MSQPKNKSKKVSISIKDGIWTLKGAAKNATSRPLPSPSNQTKKK